VVILAARNHPNELGRGENRIVIASLERWKGDIKGLERDRSGSEQSAQLAHASGLLFRLAVGLFVLGA
jgi:hypothetical protein